MSALLGRCGWPVRAGAALAVGTALLISAGPAEAYCRTTTTPVPASYSPVKDGCFTEGLVLFWAGQCVGYSVNSAASAVVSFDDATRIVNSSFATWNGASCADTGAPVGITASNFGPVTCSEVKYNQNGPNQNVIVFRDDVWPYSDPNNTLGLTTVTFNVDTGEIYDADMEINATGKNLSTADVVPANGYDLLSVITHEAGHFLGLAHAMNPTSTMFASYKPGTSSLRSLEIDDIAGICSIYPTTMIRTVDSSVAQNGAESSTACDPSPRHGFSMTCDANPVVSDTSTTSSGGCAASTGGATGSVGLAGLGALALLVHTRRRKRA